MPPFVSWVSWLDIFINDKKNKPAFD